MVDIILSYLAIVRRGCLYERVKPLQTDNRARVLILCVCVCVCGITMFPTRDRGAILRVTHLKGDKILSDVGAARGSFSCCASSCTREVLSQALSAIRLAPQCPSPPAVPTLEALCFVGSVCQKYDPDLLLCYICGGGGSAGDEKDEGAAQEAGLRSLRR